MIILVFCIGIAFVIALSVVLLVVLVNNAAENKQQASFVEENTIEYVVAGENYIRTLANVDGKILTTDGKLVKTINPVKEEAKKIGFIANWLREKWGFYWVSIFYPWCKIHKWNIIKERLKGTKEIPEGAKIRDMIERDSKPSEIDHVLAQYSRPFAVEAVETKENFSLDILVSAIFDVIDGKPMAFKYKDRFFDMLKAAVEGAVNDYIKDFAYETFLESNKGKASEFSDAIKKRLNESLVEHLGVEIIDIWIERFNLVSGGEVQKATQAMRLATLNGKALLEAADYRLKAAEKDAMTLAAPITKMGEAYASNLAVAPYVNADRITQNLAQGNSKINTLVMGQGVMPTLPIGSGGTSHPTPPPTPTTGP